MPQMIINDLEVSDIGLVPGMARYIIECIQHCFQTQNHASGVKMAVFTNEDIEEFAVIWEPPNHKNFKFSMNDADRTTDFAAMGVSLLLTTILTEYRYFITSMKGNGFDFWLYREEPDELDYTQAEGRLEISGIREPNAGNTVKRRLREKHEEISKSDYLNLRGCIAVVDFHKPQSVFEWHL